MSAYNSAKMFLLNASIAVRQFDITCISETYLDSSTPSDDNSLEISGYTLLRSGNTSNNKRVGTKHFYLQEFSMSNICKKVFVLSLKLYVT